MFPMFHLQRGIMIMILRILAVVSVVWEVRQRRIHPRHNINCLMGRWSIYRMNVIARRRYCSNHLLLDRRNVPFTMYCLPPSYNRIWIYARHSFPISYSRVDRHSCLDWVIGCCMRYDLARQSGRGYEFRHLRNGRRARGWGVVSWRVWQHLRICGWGGASMRSMEARYCIEGRYK